MISSTIGLSINQLNQNIQIQSKKNDSQCIPYFFSTLNSKNKQNIKPKITSKKTTKKLSDKK